MAAFEVDLSEEVVTGGRCRLYKECDAFERMAGQVGSFGDLPLEQLLRKHTFYRDL